MHVLELPRSVRLAAWGTAVLTGGASTADAVRAVTGDDEPHAVEPGPGPDAGPGGEPVAGPVVGARASGLTELLCAFRAAGVPGLRVALPVPGDVLGLPGPPAFNRVALAAGECVLADPAPDAIRSATPSATGLVPKITTFGSEWEQGTTVIWSVHATLAHRPAGFTSLAEAERELRMALAQATETLSRLDVARWRQDAADRIASVRDGGLPPAALPPSAPGRCVRVLATAARVRAVVELAGEDDGAAMSSFEIQRRAGALRELDGVCRRAMAAAVTGLREPAR